MLNCEWETRGLITPKASYRRPTRVIKDLSHSGLKFNGSNRLNCAAGLLSGLTDVVQTTVGSNGDNVDWGGGGSKYNTSLMLLWAQ